MTGFCGDDNELSVTFNGFVKLLWTSLLSCYIKILQSLAKGL